ncbi:hypothetical protein [Hyphomonas jannaschiana]|uniref:hypothetical protein n=1 Tax=Hyphomonas jannaschiana TaxID=86 RepID=UPI0009DE346F|nr:hypothetical protein [Hyphomonas jannaschiana]
MTALEATGKFILQIVPNAICDDCLAEKLKLTPRQHANQKTRELAKSAKFDRRKAICSYCGRTKLVIRSA